MHKEYTSQTGMGGNMKTPKYPCNTGIFQDTKNKKRYEQKELKLDD